VFERHNFFPCQDVRHSVSTFYESIEEKYHYHLTYILKHRILRIMY
jgi:hypothetical protein